MCGRFVQPEDVADEAADVFRVPPERVSTTGWQPGWNVKPTQSVLLVAEDTKGQEGRLIEPASWWLIPTWAKVKPKYPTFNARSETAFDKPTFRGSVKKRAIIPVTGYYEWRTTEAGKIPHFIHPEDGMLNLAALYSWWRPSEGDDWQLTCTILTRSAEHHMTEIHDRMPVMVPDVLADAWLDPETPGKEVLPEVSAAGVEVADSLELREVRPLRGDGPELIEPA